MGDTNKFFTKNLFIATFLLCHQEVSFTGTSSLDKHTKLFGFTPENIAREIEASYFRGGMAPAKDLFGNYNTLKDLLFQREPNRKEEHDKLRS